MALLQQGYAVTPGIDQIKETIERDVTWGRWDVNRTWVMPVVLSGTTRDRYDAGDGQGVVSQTLLRPGLLMEYVTSGAEQKKVRQWIDDGSQNIAGVLLYAETTQKFASNTDKWFGYILTGGQIVTTDIVVYGIAASAPEIGSDYGNLIGYNETAGSGSTEAAIRSYLQQNRQFLLDDFTTAIGTAT